MPSAVRPLFVSSRRITPSVAELLVSPHVIVTSSGVPDNSASLPPVTSCHLPPACLYCFLSVSSLLYVTVIVIPSRVKSSPCDHVVFVGDVTSIFVTGFLFTVPVGFSATIML